MKKKWINTFITILLLFIGVFLGEVIKNPPILSLIIRLLFIISSIIFSICYTDKTQLDSNDVNKDKLAKLYKIAIPVAILLAIIVFVISYILYY